MKKHTLSKLVAAVLLAGLINTNAHAQFMEAKEYSAEIDQVEFGNAPTAGGLIYIKRCDSCPVTGVTFHEQTRYFDGKRAITASTAEKFSDRGATLLFDPQTRYVTRVIFWTDTE